MPVEEAEEADEAEDESSSTGSSVKVSTSSSSSSSKAIGGGGGGAGGNEASFALANCLCRSLIMRGWQSCLEGKFEVLFSCSFFSGLGGFESFESGVVVELFSGIRIPASASEMIHSKDVE